MTLSSMQTFWHDLECSLPRDRNAALLSNCSTPLSFASTDFPCKRRVFSVVLRGIVSRGQVQLFSKWYQQQFSQFCPDGVSRGHECMGLYSFHIISLSGLRSASDRSACRLFSTGLIEPGEKREARKCDHHVTIAHLC